MKCELESQSHRWRLLEQRPVSQLQLQQQLRQGKKRPRLLSPQLTSLTRSQRLSDSQHKCRVFGVVDPRLPQTLGH